MSGAKPPWGVRGRHGDFRSPHVGWSQGPRLDEDDCQANVLDRYDVVVEPISDVVVHEAGIATKSTNFLEKIGPGFATPQLVRVAKRPASTARWERTQSKQIIGGMTWMSARFGRSSTTRAQTRLTRREFPDQDRLSRSNAGAGRAPGVPAPLQQDANGIILMEPVGSSLSHECRLFR